MKSSLAGSCKYQLDNTEAAPDTKELKHPQERKINRPFVGLVVFPFLLKMFIPLQKLLRIMLSLYHAIGGLSTKNRGLPNVDKLLQKTVGFNRYLQEELKNDHREDVISSNSYHQRAEIRHLRDQLDALSAHLHQLRSQFCVAQEILAFKKKRIRRPCC